ncbi:hypothetical protein CDAR_505721, partial [Caerostris darwini]
MTRGETFLAGTDSGEIQVLALLMGRAMSPDWGKFAECTQRCRQRNTFGERKDL